MAGSNSYDVVVIGGGGHGLATAYYLAKNHRIRNVAVLERGAIGLGNSGRNTQVIRSNYFYPASCAFYDHSLKLYEGLGRALNFNVMLSQRGVVNLAHSDHDMEMQRRWCNAICMSGVDSEMLTRVSVGPRGSKRISTRVLYPPSAASHSNTIDRSGTTSLTITGNGG